MPDLTHERAAWDRGARAVAGVDEVGRGPIAGPVVAAAVILDPDAVPEGIDDSKRLSPARRAALDGAIRATARVGLGEASPAEIATLNIHHATLLAMARALADLGADHALVDGRFVPPGVAGAALVRGDARSLSIAAASIVAKTWRDARMAALARRHPGYGWEGNVGYPTRAHLDALRRLGPTPIHRASFAPVAQMLRQG
ncbi:MAG: ribonuclease HII [Paracoccaceae bacterium]